MTESAFDCPGLPLAPIEPGTAVLIAGPVHDGARALALRLLAGADDEGRILVTTNRRARRIVAECDRLGAPLLAGRSAVLDCVGDEDQAVDARVLPVSGPGDLTGIGMRFGDVCREFDRTGTDRVRTACCSLSTLLTFNDLRTVSRFVHAMVGRVDALDGLAVFLVDPANHDDRAVSTFAQFCTGRIDVRAGDEGPELSAGGLPDQPREWTGFDPTGE